MVVPLCKNAVKYGGLAIHFNNNLLVGKISFTERHTIFNYSSLSELILLK